MGSTPGTGSGGAGAWGRGGRLPAGAGDGGFDISRSVDATDYLHAVQRDRFLPSAGRACKVVRALQGRI